MICRVSWVNFGTLDDPLPSPPIPVPDHFTLPSNPTPHSTHPEQSNSLPLCFTQQSDLAPLTSLPLPLHSRQMHYHYANAARRLGELREERPCIFVPFWVDITTNSAPGNCICIPS